MALNQMEAEILLNLFYGCAFEAFGFRKEQMYPRRIVKLLGDGFLAVHEYDPHDARMMQSRANDMVSSAVVFRIDLARRIQASTIHDKDGLGCGFGLSFGPCQRISIPGYPIDYVSHKINYASRLVSVAGTNELIFEKEMSTYLESDTAFMKRIESRQLKSLGPQDVGIFNLDA